MKKYTLSMSDAHWRLAQIIGNNGTDGIRQALACADPACHRQRIGQYVKMPDGNDDKTEWDIANVLPIKQRRSNGTIVRNILLSDEEVALAYAWAENYGRRPNKLQIMYSNAAIERGEDKFKHQALIKYEKSKRDQTMSISEGVRTALEYADRYVNDATSRDECQRVIKDTAKNIKLTPIVDNPFVK